jgi:hypothetical protein
VPRRNPLTAPLGKFKDAAFGAVRHPRQTADKVVEQARGTVAIGRSVAEGVVGHVAGQVTSRVGGGRDAQPESPRPARPTPAAPVTPVPSEPPAPHGDQVAKTAAKKAPARKAAAKKAPATKPTTAKTPAKKTSATPADVAKKTAEKAPATKTAARKKSPPKKTTATPADVAKKTAAPKVADPMPDAPGDRLPPRRKEDEQPPLIDPSDTKQVAAEAERGLRDATGPEGG